MKGNVFDFFKRFASDKSAKMPAPKVPPEVPKVKPAPEPAPEGGMEEELREEIKGAFGKQAEKL